MITRQHVFPVGGMSGRLLAYLQKQDAQERRVGPWQPVLPLPHGYCKATRVAEGVLQPASLAA